MRMWMIEPKLLCDKHLLGEHGEIHKHRHNFEKKHNITGRLSPVVQIEPASMEERHDELVEEMLRRGMNHNSPYEMPNLNYLEPWHLTVEVDKYKSIIDLCTRCEDCKTRILKMSSYLY